MCDLTNEKMKCDDCKRTFLGKKCFDTHKNKDSYRQNKSICDTLKICQKCERFTDTDVAPHFCNSSYCKFCKDYREYNHLCFIKPIENKQKVKKTNKRTIFIFYDFETTQETEVSENTFLHKVNFCVAQKVCSECLNEKFDMNECRFCRGCMTKIFDDGEKTLDNFVEYVLETQQFSNIEKVIVIAHNSKGFDCQFILKNILDNEKIIVEPRVILSGSKNILLNIGSINFIDSMNYSNMNLSALPKAFGLSNDVVKGTFPFHFNTQDNQNYIGVMPEKKFFGLESMSVFARHEFDEWYETKLNENYVFNFKKERLSIAKWMCVFSERHA